MSDRPENDFFAPLNKAKKPTPVKVASIKWAYKCGRRNWSHDPVCPCGARKET